jgi:CRP-like cAMP-binding protein
MHEIHLFDSAPNQVVFGAGDALFEQGDHGDEMYAIISGEVELTANGRLIDVIPAGTIVGEMALIDDSPRSCTARAKSAVSAVPVDRDRFLFLVQEHPNFGLQVMAIMADRLRKADETEPC